MRTDPQAGLCFLLGVLHPLSIHIILHGVALLLRLLVMPLHTFCPLTSYLAKVVPLQWAILCSHCEPMSVRPTPCPHPTTCYFMPMYLEKCREAATLPLV